MKKPNNIIINIFLNILNQIKIFHWQTISYSQYNAFRDYYNIMDNLIDKFIKSYQGKYNRIILNNNSTINLIDISENNINNLINTIIIFLTNNLVQNYLNNDDTDLINLRDKMLNETNKLKYLLILK
jgi:hypothetical protein